MPNTEGWRGLLVSVYRDAEFGDCTNNGISARHKRLTIIGRVNYGEWNDIIPLEESSRVFKPDADAPAVVVVSRKFGIGEYLYICPVETLGKAWHMMGGNFAYTSDSRFRQAINAYPLPIHDRIER